MRPPRLSAWGLSAWGQSAWGQSAWELVSRAQHIPRRPNVWVSRAGQSRAARASAEGAAGGAVVVDLLGAGATAQRLARGVIQRDQPSPPPGDGAADVAGREAQAVGRDASQRVEGDPPQRHDDQRVGEGDNLGEEVVAGGDLGGARGAVAPVGGARVAEDGVADEGGLGVDAGGGAVGAEVLPRAVSGQRDAGADGAPR